MRTLVLVLTALAAAPVGAQSQFAPEAGAYVALDRLDALRLGNGEVALGGAVGWRFGNGLDAGLRVGAAHRDYGREFDVDSDRLGSAAEVGVGVEGGLSRRLAGRVGLRLQLAGSLHRAEVDRQPTNVTLTGALVDDTATASRAVNEGRVSVSATAFRRVGLGPRVELLPTAGVYAAGSQLTVTAPDRGFSLRADAGRSAPDGDLGLVLALPVTVRALGTRLTVDTAWQMDLVDARSEVSTRLRVNL